MTSPTSCAALIGTCTSQKPSAASSKPRADCRATEKRRAIGAPSGKDNASDRRSEGLCPAGSLDPRRAEAARRTSRVGAESTRHIDGAVLAHPQSTRARRFADGSTACSRAPTMPRWNRRSERHEARSGLRGERGREPEVARSRGHGRENRHHGPPASEASQKTRGGAAKEREGPAQPRGEGGKRCRITDVTSCLRSRPACCFSSGVWVLVTSWRRSGRRVGAGWYPDARTIVDEWRERVLATDDSHEVEQMMAAALPCTRRLLNAGKWRRAWQQ
jgi:hypothetical protein